MLEYAKLLKNRFLAEGAAQLYRKLVKAEKDGKPFKEALEEHKPEKYGKGNQHSGYKAT